MSISNLARMLSRADKIDYDEGMLAYERYNIVMRRVAKKYDVALDRVCAAFCSLSPNNDYWGNLRSLISVLEGIKEGKDVDQIVVSTYGHCKSRAYGYVVGTLDYLKLTKGLKILNFYHNILQPHSWRWVTIDGHMVAAYRGDDNATMKQSLVKPADYERIAGDVKALAFSQFIAPNQLQAIIWFARKRSLGIVYDPQMDLFGTPNDVWRTLRDIREIKPYSRYEGQKMLKQLPMKPDQDSFL